MLWHVLMPRVCSSAKLRSNLEWICTVKKGNTRLIVPAVRWKKRQRCSPCRVFSRFLPVMLELHNPGYSHYKSCCLDFRPQTGDRLCNLVSFSIPLSFTGRCLTLLAGYLLATLKATFFAYLSIRYTQIQCVRCLCMRPHIDATAAEHENIMGCSILYEYVLLYLYSALLSTECLLRCKYEHPPFRFHLFCLVRVWCGVSSWRHNGMCGL